MVINENYKSKDTIKYKCNLSDKEKLRRLELLHAIPKLWVEALNKDLGLSANLAIYDDNQIKISQLHTLYKWVSKELYNISLCTMFGKPTP